MAIKGETTFTNNIDVAPFLKDFNSCMWKIASWCQAGTYFFGKNVSIYLEENDFILYCFKLDMENAFTSFNK